MTSLAPRVVASIVSREFGQSAHTWRRMSPEVSIRGRLNLQPRDEDDKWTQPAPISFRVRLGYKAAREARWWRKAREESWKEELEFTVPAGFVHDGSSVPRVLRAVLPWDRVAYSGLLHDLLYRHAPGGITRRKADAVWQIVSRAGTHSVGAWEAWMGRAGLFAFAWPVWRRYRKRDSVAGHKKNAPLA